MKEGRKKSFRLVQGNIGLSNRNKKRTMDKEFCIWLLNKMAKSSTYTQPVDIYREREGLLFAIKRIEEL